MIMLTGDTHGDFSRFNRKALEMAGLSFNEGDYVIVCGDFGLWKEGKELDFNLNVFFKNKPFTVLFVPGNHENYDLIKKYPVFEWRGGRVRSISENVILLERGQVFNIAGSTFFTMGGASSHDYEVILDPLDPEFATKKKRLKRNQYRVLGTEWWPEELPNEDEILEAFENLKKNKFKVDYVISHCASTSLQRDKLGKNYAPDVLTDFFEKLEKTLEYKRWFFGHYHEDIAIDDKHTCLYQSIIPLGE